MWYPSRLLNRSRDMLNDIKENTNFDPGWHQRGALFIARQKVNVSIQKKIRSLIKFVL